MTRKGNGKKRIRRTAMKEYSNRCLPRGPWVASEQYGMKFILSQHNEILWRCDWIPWNVLKAMVDAANKSLKEDSDATTMENVS